MRKNKHGFGIGLIAAVAAGALAPSPPTRAAAPTAAKIALPPGVTKPATPKRLLLVTTTVGFHHAALPIEEQLIRQWAAQTGLFTVVSTTDSPDYPAAAYKAGDDQRNARISADKAYPNDRPALAGGFDGPRGNPAQLAWVKDVNTATAPLTTASTQATAQLNQTIAAGDNPADLKAKVDAEVATVRAVADARAAALAKLQATKDKLDLDQRQALAAAGAGGGAGGGRGGAPGGAAPAPAPAPLTPAQQAAVTSLNTMLTADTQAASAARTALLASGYLADSSADVQAKADAFDTAELALANAKAEGFARIQASADKLDPAQLAQAIQGGGGGGGGRGGGRGGAPGGAPGGGQNSEQAAVTKILAQYLSADALKNYDAVAFVSTTGELPIPDKTAFYNWIAAGHGFIGIHSATDTLHQDPEYIKMIGGEFDNHGNFQPSAAVINEDPKSPINAGWGKSVTMNEEFYLFKNYDPSKVHLLLGLDKNPYTGEAGTFPLSWTKMYGDGRVFYDALGHRDDVLLPDATIGDQEFKYRFNQAPVANAVQRQMLNGILWSLGLLKDGPGSKAAK